MSNESIEFLPTDTGNNPTKYLNDPVLLDHVVALISDGRSSALPELAQRGNLPWERIARCLLEIVTSDKYMRLWSISAEILNRGDPNATAAAFLELIKSSNHRDVRLAAILCLSTIKAVNRAHLSSLPDLAETADSLVRFHVIYLIGRLLRDREDEWRIPLLSALNDSNRMVRKVAEGALWGKFIKYPAKEKKGYLIPIAFITAAALAHFFRIQIQIGIFSALLGWVSAWYSYKANQVAESYTGYQTASGERIQHRSLYWPSSPDDIRRSADYYNRFPWWPWSPWTWNAILAYIAVGFFGLFCGTTIR